MHRPEASTHQASLEDLDRRYAIHPFTSIPAHDAGGPVMMVEGSGCTLTDSAGNSYLDAMAGLWCVNIGYGNKEMADALRA
jgi:L-2,4-diaminobutyrate transaminase